MKIYNTNTIDALLTNALVGQNPIKTAGAKTAPMAMIGSRVRPMVEPRVGDNECLLPTPTDATQTNPSDFETGNSTALSIPVTVAHLSKSVHMAAPEILKGLSPVAHFVPSAIAELEKDIAALVAAKYTTAALGATDSEIAEASFAIANLKALVIASTSYPRVALMSATSLMGIAGDLDGGNYPGLSGIYEHNLTGAAGYAIVTGPSGLAYVSEQPRSFGYFPESIKVTEIELPTLKIPAWVVTHYCLATRTHWASVDLLFGCAIADPTASSYAAPAP